MTCLDRITAIDSTILRPQPRLGLALFGSRSIWKNWERSETSEAVLESTFESLLYPFSSSPPEK